MTSRAPIVVLFSLKRKVESILELVASGAIDITITFMTMKLYDIVQSIRITVYASFIIRYKYKKKSYTKRSSFEKTRFPPKSPKRLHLKTFYPPDLTYVIVKLTIFRKARLFDKIIRSA